MQVAAMDYTHNQLATIKDGYLDTQNINSRICVEPIAICSLSSHDRREQYHTDTSKRDASHKYVPDQKAACSYALYC